VRAAYAATKGKATIVNEPHTQRSLKRAMPLSASQIRGWIRSSAPPTVNYAAICASTEHITALSKMRAVLARSMCEATDWFSATSTATACFLAKSSATRARGCVVACPLA